MPENPVPQPKIDTLAVDPESAEAHYNRGIALQNVGRLIGALGAYDRAIKLKPDFADALNNRGFVLRDLDRLDEALASFDRAITAVPEFALAYSNRGVTLERLDRLDQALASYERALALRPDLAMIHVNRGVALERMGRMDEALASYDRALAFQPDHVGANVYKALLKVMLGAFEEGWRLFEWRWQAPRAGVRNFTQPLWLGDAPLAGKTLLIHTEQGLGDFIQFCRYVPLAGALGARIILETPGPLLALMKTLAGTATLVKAGDSLPPFDLHCPIMSLPLAFDTTLATVPATIPYLQSDADKAAAWAQRLGATTRFRIGVAWNGGFRPNQTDVWHVNRRRNVPLRMMAALDRPDIDFYSLQKGGPAEAELAALHGEVWPSGNFYDLTGEIRDFSDTAALIANLDLVISVDTAVAHLAGALGKPVWILNRFDTCWRWLLDRTDSPWYPTATLYRQKRLGDWHGVVARVQSDLRSAVA